MAKTVTAMLIGIAIGEGRIRSVDDLAAAYVPELAGTEYGRTSLRHLLQMSSGVRFNEDYSSPGFIPVDGLQLILDTYMRVGPGGVGAVTSFNDRERPAGAKFSYASVETQVLGLVLARAIGRSVPSTCRRRSGSRSAPRPTRRGSLTTRARKPRTAASTPYCAITLALGSCWRMTATGAAARSSRPHGFWRQPPCTWTNRMCGPARPRQTRATATRRGSFPTNAGCSCSGARKGSGSTSILGASSSW
jgi:hypothetical protein